MLDFLRPMHKSTRDGVEVYPELRVGRTKDLMIRGGSFYAIWDETNKSWSTDRFRAIELIDRELDIYRDETPGLSDARVSHLSSSESGYAAKWNLYCTKLMPDTFTALDEKLVFSDEEPRRELYSSHRLNYSMYDGSTEAWDSLIGTLYSEEERAKIEWAIGAVVSGDSKHIQKFLVFYGDRGTGKSTVLHIMEQLFDGYWAPFEAESLASASSAFSLEQFKNNPLVAIQHDGNLSRIETNTKLNSLVSHEAMSVNEKFKSLYSTSFNAMLFMGTNRPVHITDPKSGLLRRLIDVKPTGKKIPRLKYDKLFKAVSLELGAIAKKCLDIYKNDPYKYESYVPTDMMGATNDFYNFVLEQYDDWKASDQTTLNEAWLRYKQYVNDAMVPFAKSKRIFKNELMDYFYDFQERGGDRGREWNVYIGFRADRFEVHDPTIQEEPEIDIPDWLFFRPIASLLDDVLAECPAQYTKQDGTPLNAWDFVETRLCDLNSRVLHYVRPPKNHIVIDFDLKTNGQKDLSKNLQAASVWPRTYAELSKSGTGIHLHYIYNGNPEELQNLFSENVEIKVFSGKSSLRRKLTLCNDVPIAQISGLPTRRKKMVTGAQLKSEQSLRRLIERNLRKEIMGATKPSIDFIKKILDDANGSGLKYDIRDMRPSVMAFAVHSTNNAQYCLEQVSKMQFASSDVAEDVPVSEEAPIVMFDCEVFPNLFVVAWKIYHNPEVTIWYNPTGQQIQSLLKYRLAGYYVRNYDNHIFFARMMGYNNAQLFELSQRLTSNSPNSKFGSAYNMSYVDIYDMSSEKMSLKKFEIKYGIHHQECPFDWNLPVPEDKWVEVGEYCKNDVIAEEVVFDKRIGDFEARRILASLSGLTVNDTTNSHTTKLIFGDDKHPQSQFNYVKLAGEGDLMPIQAVISKKTGKTYPVNPEYTCIDSLTGQMAFPGYTFEYVQRGSKMVPVSMYRGVEVGEGGYVWGEPGMYRNVKVKDVVSMHPHSVIAMKMFGPIYTKIFEDIVRARVAIKHGAKTGDFSELYNLFGGRLVQYVENKDHDSLALLILALKIAINSVYGLTAAKFDNPFHDPRNVDNIVAKRGALFMINLKHELEDKGAHVIHLKTDSLKIEDLSEELEDFIDAYGELYGYSFDTESVYDRICLVNDAVYIAKCSDEDPETPGEWHATGKQFAVPYVMKTLFTHEPIQFEDLCEVFSVSTKLYLDFDENLPEGTEHNLVFVGKIGEFCPIVPGANGGTLLRAGENGYSSPSGSKGWRWMESEIVKQNGLQDNIDIRYYQELADEALATIGQYGDAEAFRKE